MDSQDDFIEKLYRKIKVLNETIWENRAVKPKILKWLDNFTDDREKLNALFILSKFMYFGSAQMRYLLKSLYRDLYKYPIIKEIRKTNGDTLDEDFVENKFKEIERNTRFIGVGNPSESGAHMLYFFRQENKVSKHLFIYTDDVINLESSSKSLQYPNVSKYIFIDDFCGSGSQVSNNSIIKKTIEDIKILKPDSEIIYLMLFGTSTGIKNISDSLLFDRVEAVIELDNSFKCFDESSRYFKDADTFVNKDFAKSMAYKYGFPLIRSIIEKEGGCPDSKLDLAAHSNALGFSDCQLLMGFHHNTPDNTLPIIWYEEEEIAWEPIFRRYNKKYGI